MVEDSGIDRQENRLVDGSESGTIGRLAKRSSKARRTLGKISQYAKAITARAQDVNRHEEPYAPYMVLLVGVVALIIWG